MNIIASYCISMAWVTFIAFFFISIAARTKSPEDKEAQYDSMIVTSMYSVGFLLIATGISYFIKPSFTHFILFVFGFQFLVYIIPFIKGINSIPNHSEKTH